MSNLSLTRAVLLKGVVRSKRKLFDEPVVKSVELIEDLPGVALRS